MPNVIEMSGRGYHLVWYIDQVAAALGWMVEAVSVFFAQTVQMLLTDSGAKGYQADIGYAHRIAGLTRIPGTYNTAAHAYAGYRTLHKGRMDLLKAYDSIPPSGQRGAVHTAFPAVKEVSADMASIGKKRMDALLCLNAIRPIQVSQRDMYCLHFFRQHNLRVNLRTVCKIRYNRAAAHEKKWHRHPKTGCRRRRHDEKCQSMCLLLNEVDAG